MSESTSNLPAVAVSRQPCENPKTIIWRWNPSRFEEEHEVFGSLTEALAHLETWKVEFPWNTYHVATEVLTHTATTELDPVPYITFRIAGGQLTTATFSQGSPDGETTQAEKDRP